MNITSLGDMAQSYAMQTRNGTLKQDIQRLPLELSSGRVADVRKVIGGNAAYVNDLERSLKKLDGYDLATLEASQFVSGAQAALSRMGDLNTSFRDTLLTTSGSAMGDSSSFVLDQAKSTFTDLVSAMNTSVSGRSVFGGIATDMLPIAPAEDLLAALSTAISGAGTVDDIITAAQVWFDDPAGYGAVGYLGSDTTLAPLALSDEENALFDLRGDDPALRNMLKNFAIMALADDPTLGLSVNQQNELYQKSPPGVMGASSSIIDLQAKIGFSEGRIETITVRNSAERTSLQIARNDLLGVNPYETATELEQVQFQLQSLYAITSRMSQLSLVNYL
jgi:flagellar hook-associated protein 3 FlgL